MIGSYLRYTFFALALGLLPAVSCASTPEVVQEIEKLDRVLALADEYVASHEIQLKTIENLLQSRGVSLEQQYEIYGQLYDKQVAFQFDKAMETLDKQLDIAHRLGDRQRTADAQIRKAMLYTTSGMFLEANVLLSKTIDTTQLTRLQLIEYYNTQQRFYVDFSGYTQTPEMNRLATAKIRYYRDRILRETTAASEIRRYMEIRDCMDRQDYVRADRLNRQLLAQYNPNSHDYAIHAYDQAVICEALSQFAERNIWYARSAMADIKSATKDNASLCCLARIMLQENNIDRAFRYITISLNDALFYNAKLRPWQIAIAFPTIERAYDEARAQQEHVLRNYLIVVSVFAVVLLGTILFIIYMYCRARKSSQKIESMNRQIQEYNESLSAINAHAHEMNRELLESNAVKEEYIGLFLSMCSNYIDKLMAYQSSVRRKLSKGQIAELKAESSSQDLMNAELSSFYEVFDNAFLSLYPNFVEEFNGLLKPSAHIELKKGERLNTELRIFALIRLGITDSSRIALLLRYSVNTIYNYRARIKNSASGNRDDFEERIKNIGVIRLSEQTRPAL